MGCELLREGRKHTVYYSAANNKTVTMPRHSEIKNPTARKIGLQLGVSGPLK